MPEVTDNYVRIPVGGGVKEGEEIRTIDIAADEGIKALYSVGGKAIRTYMFATDKGWNMSKAQDWISKHKNEATAESVASLTKIELELIKEDVEKIIRPVNEGASKAQRMMIALGDIEVTARKINKAAIELQRLISTGEKNLAVLSWKKLSKLLSVDFIDANRFLNARVVNLDKDDVWLK